LNALKIFYLLNRTHIKKTFIVKGKTIKAQLCEVELFDFNFLILKNTMDNHGISISTLDYLTASFKALPALNAGTVVAAIWIAAPV
jgi:hypothetical protein